SDNTFHVALAPYPDLLVENLAVTGPSADGRITVSWNTANRGDGPARGSWKDRVIVKNVTTNTVALDTEVDVTGPLAPNATIPHTVNVTLNKAGHYQVVVMTDSRNQIFEFNPQGAEAAKANNTSQTSFDATLDLQVANLKVDPATQLQ